MRRNNYLSRRFTVFLLAAILTAGAFFSMPGIGISADTPDCESYKVGFEHVSYETDADRNHTTTQAKYVRGGNRSAKLTVSAGQKEPTVDNMIYLVDDNGNSFVYEQGYTYYFGFYVKADTDSVGGEFRIEVARNSMWAVAGQTKLTADGTWQYGWAVYTPPDNVTTGQWKNQKLGLYVTGGLITGTSYSNLTVYLDNVTIIKLRANEAGVVMAENNNGTDITYSIGRIGEKAVPETPSKTNDEFLGWYTDENLTESADNVKYSAEMQTVYAGYKSTVGAFKYTAYSIGFESAKYDNSDCYHATEDSNYVRRGKKAARLTVTAGQKDPTTNNTVYLVDDKGNSFVFRRQHFKMSFKTFVKAYHTLKAAFHTFCILLL